MDIPQLEAMLEILKKVQEKFEVLKEDYYKSASDEEYLTIEASLSEIDQEIQHLERDKLSVLFLNIILEKLDRESRKQYELTLKDNEVPDFDEFLNRLERRNQILNSIKSNAVVKLNQEKPKSFFVKNNKSTKNCRVCNLIHPIYHCEKFKEMKLADRLEIVKRFKLCYSCLNSHLNFNCASNGVCRVCKKKSHHTLLHKYSTAVINQTPLDESLTPIQNCPTQTISPLPSFRAPSISFRERKSEKCFDKRSNNLCEKLTRKKKYHCQEYSILAANRISLLPKQLII
ncbi:DUF1758 domain-containing protein [Nephila pilipes]|uniref:DUF1758 domain-containing protein n=1 Tax=Nephila pilipes TaxID=299642 RepID=A0A8X6N115_NEPPI|nr:DUF1758 domain-containing protein [Nephila pilipes]